MKKNKHIGSGFDEFLREEGLLAETEAAAVKRVAEDEAGRRDGKQKKMSG